jgi:hypothetical protein
MGRILLITGSRSLASFPQSQVYHVFDLIFKRFAFNPFEGDRVIVGGAKGIDMMMLNYMMNLGRINNDAYTHAYDVIRAEWDKYGKAAGPIRNKKMVKICTMGAGVWDGSSKGTEQCINELKKAGKLLLLVTL